MIMKTNKFIIWCYVMGGMLMLTIVVSTVSNVYAFDFDKKFDVTVLKPVQKKYEPILQSKQVVSLVEEAQVSKKDVVVSTSTRVNDFEVKRSYDDVNGVICYLYVTNTLSCIKVK